MRKRHWQLVAGLALIAAAVIAIPAIGSSGPQAQTSNATDRIARKALRIAKSVQRSALSDVRVVDGRSYSVPPGGSTVDVAGYGGFTADCPNGYRVVGTGWEGDFGDMWRVQSYEFFVGGFGTNDASISGDFQLQAICARIGTGALRRGETVAELKSRYAHDNREDQAEWRASSTSP